MRNVAASRCVAWSLVLSATAGAGVSSHQTFRSTTRVVPIYATVTGPNGRLMPDLKVDDFVLLDNGVPQTITTFSKEPVPIVGVALWDVSNSMDPNAERVRASARAFVRALWPEDRFKIGSFGGTIVISPLLTNDKSILARVVDEELWFGGGTPLWTAIAAGLDEVSQEIGRRIVVVVTDGQTLELQTSKTDVMRQMHRSDAMVYAIGFSPAGLSGAIKDVVDESGGGHAELGDVKGFDAELARVAAELHHQYVLGFSPQVLDGKVHKLAVSTRVSGAKVRARKGYVAEAKVPVP